MSSALQRPVVLLDRQNKIDSRGKTEEVEAKLQGCVRYGTGILGSGMDVVPNLPKCPVPVLTSYRTYRSVRYRYWRCVELADVSDTGTKICTVTAGTGIDVMPNLPNFRYLC